MTAQQLRLLGDDGRQLPLVAESEAPEPAPLSGECPWCGRVDVCVGGPDCRYVSAFAPALPLAEQAPELDDPEVTEYPEDGWTGAWEGWQA